jgi:predicted ATPase
MLAGLNYSLLAEAHRQAGRPQEALAATEVGLDRAESTGERFFEAELHRIRGELLLHRSPEDVAEAKASLSTALAVSRAQGARALELRTQASVEQLQLVGVDKEISPRRSGRSS